MIPEIEKIEFNLINIYKKFQLLHIKSTDHNGDGQWKITVNLLKGSNIEFEVKEIYTRINTMENIPKSKKVYSYNQTTNEWISLDPYISFEKCPVCKHKRVLLYDGENRLDPLIGHRFNIQEH